MNALFFLYDASGSDDEIEPNAVNTKKLRKDQLLWVNVLDKTSETLREVAGVVAMPKFETIVKEGTVQRPTIENYGDFFHFNIVSVKLSEESRPEALPIDFVVGKNLIITSHEGDVEYFQELRDREKGETQVGDLAAETFLATLLDLHLVSYFKALEQIEHKVDRLDSLILRTQLDEKALLERMVELRTDISKLRRWLTPHREVFYALTRSDFLHIAGSNAVEDYRTLSQHFESAVDAVEGSREMVLSIFDLAATKSAQETNVLIRKLTFFTLIVGSLGVIAGIFGMNYQLSYFEAESGFWFTVAAMGAIAALWAVIAKLKKWI